MPLCQDAVGFRERVNSLLKVAHSLRVAVPEAGASDCLHNAQDVVDPVSEFEGGDLALPLKLDSIGNVGILLHDQIGGPEPPETFGPNLLAGASHVTEPPAPFLSRMQSGFNHREFLGKHSLQKLVGDASDRLLGGKPVKRLRSLSPIEDRAIKMTDKNRRMREIFGERDFHSVPSTGTFRLPTACVGKVAGHSGKCPGGSGKRIQGVLRGRNLEVICSARVNGAPIRSHVHQT